MARIQINWINNKQMARKKRSVEKIIAEIENQLKELDRQEHNILKLSIESREADAKTLDELLLQNQREKQVLQDYLATFRVNQINHELLEEGLRGVAERLRALVT